MAEASLAERTPHRKTQTAECGCTILPATRTKGCIVVEGCTEARELWAELLSARDATAADGRRVRGVVGKKKRLDAFAAARDRYHDHVRGAS